jgi:hypothetical protein
MSWVNVKPLFCLRANPTIKCSPTRENQRVWSIVVKDRQLQVPIKRRFGDNFPHLGNVLGLNALRFDVNQKSLEFSATPGP